MAFNCVGMKRPTQGAMRVASVRRIDAGVYDLFSRGMTTVLFGPVFCAPFRARLCDTEWVPCPACAASLSEREEDNESRPA